MGYQVSISGSDIRFEVGTEETVLDAALRAGVPLRHDCRLGGCGTCRVRLQRGGVRYDEPPFGISPEEEEAGYALLCQARPQSDLVLIQEPDFVAHPARRHSATVRAIDLLGRDVLHLRLEVDEDLVYVPGQYMNVHLRDGSARSFSMASVPKGGELDFHVRRIAGGRFTDRMLAQARAGDRLDIELPLGAFHYREQDYRPIVMIATGTGLAPIRAILESLLDDPDCPPVTLYWGMRTQADLYLHEELLGWRERLYDFNYVPVLSRPGPDWQGRRGYVQQAVAEDFDDLSEHAIYLCGSPAMIGDARAVLLARSASIDHVYSDSFHFAHQLTQERVAA